MSAPEASDDQISEVLDSLHLLPFRERHPMSLSGGQKQRLAVATALKECFKSIYGQPINTYMRNFRLDQAALLLQQEPQMGVAEIAGRVGYDSSSKFAAAFKEVKGKTPLEYRRESQ